MPIRQNKKHLEVPAGVTLIEVMIVLAISGLLVVAAIATLGSRNSVLFETSVQKTVNDIRTVVNEARSGLGPAGSQQANQNDNEAYLIPSSIPSGWAIFGEAVEFDNNCSPSGLATAQSCLRVYKLMKSTVTTVHDVIPYERYTIDLPTNLKFDHTSTTNPMIVYTNSGQPDPAYFFTKTSGINGGASGVSGVDSASLNFSDITSLASDYSNYTSAHTTAMTIKIQDRNNPTEKFATLKFDMTNPINVTAEMP